MKKFIKKLSLFFIPILIYFGTNIILNYHAYNDVDLNLKKFDILIDGDSHTHRGINPDKFNNALNISQNGEPYVISFWKIKKVFKKNIPDTLILGFAPHNISAFNDLKFSNEKWAYEMFKRSYPIQDYYNLNKKIKLNYYILFKTWMKFNALKIWEDHIQYIGHYENSNLNDPSDWESSIKRHYYEDDNLVGNSETAISYLDSIVNLCISKNVKLILVSHPVHKTYQTHIPEINLNRFNKLKRKLEKNNTIIDLTFKKYPDSLFYNSDHLNTDGAERYTNELIGILKGMQDTLFVANFR
ncbi:hypothetical protein [Robertkochia solimangrovi]|uniref:hypothetical protein n=1 Tax=Robertkochia solimangrovi TaxID=2213046 RepID=UPI00117FBA49|nr:hypothetical protein [Robertkochia solimangrovi]